MIRAGQLRHVIELQKRGDFTDDAGNTLPQWEKAGTARAMVKHLSGRELEQAASVDSRIRYEVRLHWSGLEITPDWRVLHRSRALNVIHAANLDERDRVWKLLCEESTQP